MPRSRLTHHRPRRFPRSRSDLQRPRLQPLPLGRRCSCRPFLPLRQRHYDLQHRSHRRCLRCLPCRPQPNRRSRPSKNHARLLPLWCLQLPPRRRCPWFRRSPPFHVHRSLPRPRHGHRSPKHRRLHLLEIRHNRLRERAPSRQLRTCDGECTCDSLRIASPPRRQACQNCETNFHVSPGIQFDAPLGLVGV